MRTGRLRMATFDSSPACLAALRAHLVSEEHLEPEEAEELLPPRMTRGGSSGFLSPRISRGSSGFLSPRISRLDLEFYYPYRTDLFWTRP